MKTCTNISATIRLATVARATIRPQSGVGGMFAIGSSARLGIIAPRSWHLDERMAGR